MATEANGTAAQRGYRLVGMQVVETELVVVGLFVSDQKVAPSEFGSANLFGE